MSHKNTFVVIMFTFLFILTKKNIMHACFIVGDEPEIQITFNFTKLKPVSNIV